MPRVEEILDSDISRMATLKLFSKGPSIKYVTLQGGGGVRKCDSL